MRGTLIYIVLLAAVIVAVGQPADAGSDLTWSAGVSLTESQSAVQIGSRIEALRGRLLLGCWFSSSGQLPVMVQGLDYQAFLDCPGIGKIEKVVLSPDKGATEWEAEMVPSKGYRVKIPTLSAGAYGLEWGVRSRDKHNRLQLVVIPISWTSGRSSSATNQAMVQRSPLGSENFSDQEWFACLRGFVPAWATLDPAFLAQQQLSQMAPAPIVAPAPVAPVAKTTAPAVENPPPPATAEPAPTVEALAFLPEREEVAFDGEVMLVLDGREEFPVTITAELAKGDILVFRRGDKFVAETEIVELAAGRFLEAQVLKGGDVRPHDAIFIREVR